MTKEEIERLYYYALNLKTGIGLRNAIWYWLSFHHALRISEALNLRWNNFQGFEDGEYQSIFIQRAKGSKSGTHKLDDREKRDLNKLKAWYSKKNVFSDNGCVFLSDNATDPYTACHPNSLTKHLKEDASILWSAAKAKMVSAHSLRHGCGYHLASQGMEIQKIADWMGHANIRNTEIYLSISKQMIQDIQVL